MPDIGADYLEQTRFHSDTFRFRCFPLLEADTFPHWHNHLEFVHSTRLSNDVHVNGFLHVLDCGDVLVIPPGSLHSIRVQGSEYTAMVIGEGLLTGLTHDSHLAAVVRPFMNALAFAPIHLTTVDCARTEVSSLLDRLVREDAQKDPGYEGAIKAILCLLLGVLVRERPELAEWTKWYHEDATQTMKTALVHLANHYDEKVTLLDMSRLTNLSIQHFCRLFKSHTGKTFLEYLTLLRLEHAYRLLVDTGMPITRIPERTGFCNGHYFSRVFRAQYGKTPSAVRKQHGCTLPDPLGY